MTDIRRDGTALVVQGSDARLTYESRTVTLDSGEVVKHESQGGSLSSVWATDLGDCYVEVVFLGDGPVGGELVLVVPGSDVVAVGDLYPAEAPAHVGPTWPVAVDMALGLVTETTTIYASTGVITKDDLDTSHQRLLGSLYGHG